MITLEYLNKPSMSTEISANGFCFMNDNCLINWCTLNGACTVNCASDCSLDCGLDNCYLV